MNLTSIIDSIHLMLLISLCTGVFWVVWQHILTAPSGLISFIPKIYPNNGLLAHLLRCEACLTGWSVMIATALLSKTITTALIFIPISGTMGIFSAIIATRLIGK